MTEAAPEQTGYQQSETSVATGVATGAATGAASAAAGAHATALPALLPSFMPASVAPAVAGKRRGPVDCGDLPFVIRRDGTWMYMGSPIGRKELVCLFASVLKRDADGTFLLETPAERGRIVVEDAPFVAVELDWTGDGKDQRLSFRTNVDQIVTAGPDNPIRVVHNPDTEEPVPYIVVRPGAGRHAVEARINRAVYYELVALAEPEWVDDRHLLGVWSQGRFFSLGDVPAEEE